MQMLFLGMVCAMASCVASSGLAGWPAAAYSLPVLRTVVPPSTRGFAYSTTQYINSLPAQYPFGLQPQAVYSPQQSISVLSPFQSTFYPFSGPTYFPAAGAVYYPPPAPILPQDTIASAPGVSFPPQPSGQPGDADTEVVDSAQFPDQTPSVPNSEDPTPAPPSQPQFPPAGAPILPSFPQFPQGSLPGFPSFPQLPEGSFPNFPTVPQIPTNPPFPQAPSEPQPSFPSADREDKGLNDEDTISVESASRSS